MPDQFPKSKSEYRQRIINEYIAAHPEQIDWTMEDVAAWAIRNDKWQPSRRSIIKVCASELASAARIEYETDPQGRRVRTKHARRETVMEDGQPRQMVFWEDHRTATEKHMRVSLQQRRTGILADCGQLKRDTDSYNENNPHGASIPISYDFTEDLFELEASDEYPEGPPDEDYDPEEPDDGISD